MDTQVRPLASMARSSPATSREGSPRPAEETVSEAVRSEVPGSFCGRFCNASRCPSTEFTDRVFLLTLYFHALPVAVLFWPWRKRVFRPDYALIEKLGAARWRGDIQWKLNRLVRPEWRGGLGRRLLRCRISTRRLGALMAKVMATSSEG